MAKANETTANIFFDLDHVLGIGFKADCWSKKPHVVVFKDHPSFLCLGAQVKIEHKNVFNSLAQ